MCAESKKLRQGNAFPTRPSRPFTRGFLILHTYYYTDTIDTFSVAHFPRSTAVWLVTYISPYSKAPAKSHRTGITLLELAQMFPDEEAARRWFEAIIWADGRVCPNCGSDDTYEANHAKVPGVQALLLRENGDSDGTVPDSPTEVGLRHLPGCDQPQRCVVDEVAP
ncbi:transposase [Candidatus Poriferisocius sp.]|uniref:transposase n=1 Tax=Candidatus Poriferisocius sp. TaxID=3101276 RepID=UPI003B024237